MSILFSCRSCRSGQGSLVLDLGAQPLANNLLRPEDLVKTEPTFPLRLSVCHQCWLLQILETVPPTDLFSEYLYFSSFSEALLRHARDAAERYLREFSLKSESLVVEIASNDGYLLQNFVAANVPCLGIEPAANIAKVARDKGIETICDFFGITLAQKLVEQGRAADLILGNNVFAHVPEINGFVAALEKLLKPGGSVVLEFPYGVDLIDHNEFDTIYHEHVFYFTLTPLLPLFQKHGLEVWNVERIPIHGGSLRLFAGHRGQQPVRNSVSDLLSEERSRGVNTLDFYESFARKIMALKQDLLTLLRDLQKEGKRVAAYGASAKGSTLLNFFGLGRNHLTFVVDRSTYKQGRLTPGTHLPIMPVEELVRQRPGYTLLLTWNFAEEVLRQQQEYRSSGGKFIIPIPRVQVV